jgi:hypothetical protein
VLHYDGRNNWDVLIIHFVITDSSADKALILNVPFDFSILLSIKVDFSPSISIHHQSVRG